ncbi:helix-turn-helix domain-containing protein [Streptomyces mirabilis]|nr:helix-turn-helix domain-containing protein [Streptomyces scabiei]MCQ9182167.1 helix-turn-helix domain-containing protein [Streptomyces hayashii]MDX3114563.1 helix-turn-helix domain-containing protein [Streptomyces scabiei]
MNVADVATYLGVPKSWVYENWKREQLPFRKIGQALRIRPVDLDRWFDSQEGV